MPAFEVPNDLREKLIARRGRLHAYESYDPVATALVVVDMQNHYQKVCTHWN
jgi:hypothetical protein